MTGTCGWQELQREHSRLNHEFTQKTEDIKNNQDKIKLNKQLPYLVGNIVEVHCRSCLEPPRPNTKFVDPLPAFSDSRCAAG